MKGKEGKIERALLKLKGSVGGCCVTMKGLLSGHVFFTIVYPVAGLVRIYLGVLGVITSGH